jgi:hypothetical protein
MKALNVFFGIGAYLVALSAAADIRLVSPLGRGGGALLSSAPCAQAEKGAPVSTHKSSERIFVRWDETVYRPGTFSIDFSERSDGNFINLVSNIPHNINPETSKSYSLYIQLPNVTCANCTLRVVQVLSDVINPLDAFLYSCSDIQLEPGGGANSDGTNSKFDIHSSPPETKTETTLPGFGCGGLGSGAGRGPGGAGGLFIIPFFIIYLLRRKVDRSRYIS